MSKSRFTIPPAAPVCVRGRPKHIYSGRRKGRFEADDFSLFVNFRRCEDGGRSACGTHFRRCTHIDFHLRELYHSRTRVVIYSYGGKSQKIL
jgi:hypothetical protein